LIARGVGCRAVARAQRRGGVTVSCVVPFTRPGQDKKHLVRSDSWILPPLDDSIRKLLLDELDWLSEGLEAWAKRSGADSSPNPVISPLAEFERRAEAHFRDLLERALDPAGWRLAVRRDISALTRPTPLPGRTCDEVIEREAARIAIDVHFPLALVPAVSRSALEKPYTIKRERNQFLARLERLDAASRTALKDSALRPGTLDVAAHDAFTAAWWPVRNSKLPRDACRLVASLYFWHPKSGGTGNLADSLRNAASKHTDPLSERLVTDLLAAPPARRNHLLLVAVRRLAAARVAIDWSRLIDDLQNWDRVTVQRMWANSWHSTKRSSDVD